MKLHSKFHLGRWSLGVLLVALVAAQAAQAQRPGIDRPIRVGMLNGIGQSGGFNHTNLHTASSVVAALLASPAGANLGDSLVIPNAGFVFYNMPVATSAGVSCSGATGCGPTLAQVDTIIGALDTLDVLIMNSNVGIGQLVSSSVHRQAFETFWATKGLVSVHFTTDSKGLWAKLDTVNGTQFNNHPAEQIATLRVDSVFKNDASWRYLNQGVFSNGADTAFIEEWMFYTNSGAEIRARSNLKPTTKVVENGMNVGSLTPMGDHPHSWFRAWPTGGRTFYTGLGHRANVWQSTRTFRRQLYNAILWTAKYDSLSTVSLSPTRKTLGDANHFARFAATPGTLTITAMTAGSHSVELLSLDGRRAAAPQTGEGLHAVYTFADLRPGVYAVAVTTSAGRTNRLVTVP